jgi:hypothetical protein
VSGEASATYVGDGDGLIVVTTEVLEQVLDEDGALGDLALDLEGLVVRGREVDNGAGFGSSRHACGDLVFVYVVVRAG